MNRGVLKPIRMAAGDRFGWLQATVHWLLFGLFLLDYGLVLARVWRPLALAGEAQWPEGLLLVLATATTLTSLSRQRPGQNVLLAAVLIAFIAGAAHTLGALTGVPFGRYQYTDRIGQELFHPLPWAVPLIWVVVILNCRGVGRLLLRAWRRSRTYGLWLLGLTVVLALLMDLGLEPFATTVKQYWRWEATRVASNWYTTPWVNFLGWAVTALLILAFVTPVLINKKPVEHAPDLQPLCIWLLVNVLFLAGAATHQNWGVVWLGAAQCVVVVGALVVGRLVRRPAGAQ
jgi:uncharacterized membrane protein